jgi:hypothetical protein
MRKIFALIGLSKLMNIFEYANNRNPILQKNVFKNL